MLRWLLPLLLALLPSAANAAWLEAQTKHFIVYSDSSEKNLRAAATDLEKYDHLLRLVLETPDDNPIRVKVYLLGSIGEVQQSMGEGINTGVAGYYEATARGPIAVGIRGALSLDFTGQMVLFHEYAHHVMLQYFPAAFPLWYVEGFAEYFAPTRILPNGYEIGNAARYRFSYPNDDAYWLPMKKMLTGRNYKDIDDKVDQLYSEGWLLTHYLLGDPERSKQLHKYLALINHGTDYKSAMEATWGHDAAGLETAIRSYAMQHHYEALRVTFPSLDVGPVDVQPLSPARAALIQQEIALGRGVFAKDAASFAASVRSVAGKYPDDPDALAMLTEAERIAGNHDAAAAAVDRWLAKRSGEPRALMLKGMIAIDALVAAHSQDQAALQAARDLVFQARKAAPEDPMILEAFYDAYATYGRLPGGGAQSGLFHAMELVPQDDHLRYKVAVDFERRGLIEAAINAIAPAAYRAHQSDDESQKDKEKRARSEERWRVAGETKPAERPREMLARLQALLAGGKAAPAAAPPH
ncbi:MAG TPA: hypothetical protein VFW19_13765 [Allosphingosinicella sp.]|nr:hypothetical protein [Allosphingosinicella sp.]